MNKLTALIKAAKAYKAGDVVTDYRKLTDPDTILELCALLEKAENARESERRSQRRIDHFKMTLEAFAAIKQWKEQA